MKFTPSVDMPVQVVMEDAAPDTAKPTMLPGKAHVLAGVPSMNTNEYGPVCGLLVAIVVESAAFGAVMTAAQLRASLIVVVPAFVKDGVEAVGHAAAATWALVATVVVFSVVRLTRPGPPGSPRPLPLGVAAVQHGLGLPPVEYSMACPFVGVKPVQNGTPVKPMTWGSAAVFPMSVAT